MILYSGEENGIVVEESAKDSIFADQYTRAHFIVDEMVKKAVQFQNIPVASRQKTIGSTPNIVAFCGDRGEGKTSCMESVIRQLKSGRSSELVFMDTIDPAFFDNEHNIVEILLGLLFRDFQQRRDQQRKDKEMELGRSLQKEEEVEFREKQKTMSRYFQDARQCLREMYEDRDVPFDALDKLTNMVQGISLHEKIEVLIENYLVYCEGKKALVICIDDTDLNMKGAYEMLEKIRIYLNNPFCVILMSTKLEQLQKVVADGLGTQVKNTAGFPLQTMAMRYIIKVIPIGRQIHMPKVYSLCDEKLTLCSGRSADGIRQEYPSVKDAVVRMIFNKTRFLFYNSRGSVSLIIPNNLRSFRHLVGMLYNMEEFGSRDDSRGNMEHFIHYFYQTWTEQLDDDKRRFIEALVLVQDIISLNKIVVNELARYLTEEQKTVVNRQDILNSNVANYNVSLGDVFYVLDVMDRSNTDSQLLMFTFFIRSFYSIKLYETYDKLTDNIKTPIVEREDGVGEIYRTDQLFKKTSLIHRLLNGSYFTYLPKDILPSIGNTDQARDYKVLEGKTINGLVRNASKKISAYLRHKSNGSQDAEDKAIQMLEYLSLTLRKYVSTSELETFYRKDKDISMPTHLAPFTSSCNYYVFDALLPFVNIIDIEAAYNRFSGIPENALFRYALDHEWSLLRRMMRAVKNKEIEEKIWDAKAEAKSVDDGSYKYHRLRLASNITIRNGEVLSAVFEGIKSRRFVTYSSSKNNVIMGEFYDKIMNSQMHTYPKSSTEPAYTIKFSSLGAIGDWLKGIDEDYFNGYFVFINPKVVQATGNKKQRTEKYNQDVLWAKSHFEGLDLEEDKRYNRDDVAQLLVDKGYKEEYSKVPKAYWDNAFKTAAPMKPGTIMTKLASLRMLFELAITDVEFATDEDIDRLFENENPKNE